MHLHPKANPIAQRSLNSLKAVSITDNLHRLAFENAAQSIIITLVKTGKIIKANRTACKLLGYSKKDLMTKSRSLVFNIRETGFKKMLKERTAEGHCIALVSAVTKKGKKIPCEISSAIFLDENNIENAITTLTDLRPAKLVQKEIDLANEKIVSSDIMLVKSVQKLLDVEKERTVSRNISVAKSRQKTIDNKKDKAVAKNIILAQKRLDDRLAENNEWIKYIAKASYDVMWDWDVVTGGIYIGDSACEVFGYKAKDNSVTFKAFEKKLITGERKKVLDRLSKSLAAGNKTWNDSFKLRRKDGSIAVTTSRASIIRDEAGKAIRLIGATQDISRLQDLENELLLQISIQKAGGKREKIANSNRISNISKQKKLDTLREKTIADNILIAQDKSDARVAAIEEIQQEKFLLASSLSFDIIWEWDLLTNEVFIGDGYEDLFGYKIEDNKGDMQEDWINHLHEDDRETIKKELDEKLASSSTNWEHAYRVYRADGTVAKVFVRASIIRYPDGKAYRLIGALQDISRQKELEDKLEFEIILKERQIEEATEDAKDTERSDIGKELHDNVNQLLGASRMYLEMARHGGANSQVYLSRSSEYTLTAIEEIRKLTKGLTTDVIKNLGLYVAIENLVNDTMETNRINITCSLADFKEESVSDKFKLAVLRIVQEALTNILKHAHATEVRIFLCREETKIILLVVDNGVGFDTGQKRKGIGLANIKSRAASFGGNIELESRPGHGCSLKVIFQPNPSAAV